MKKFCVLKIDHDNISDDTNPLFENGLCEQEDWNVGKESLCNHSQTKWNSTFKTMNAGSLFQTIAITKHQSRFDNTHFISFAPLYLLHLDIENKLVA